MANKRMYYAVHQVGFSKCGLNTYTSAHGVQSVGMTTRFNLDAIFEVGQLEVYEQSEQLPEVEVTVEKVLDGYPLLYHLATNGAVTGSLSGRSNIKSTVGISFYSDVQDSASGTALAQCTVSGVYVSTLNYTIPETGPMTESLTLVGNNKVWNNTFSPTAFTNTDEPLAVAGGSGGVQYREDLLMGESASTRSKFPTNIPGISASGYNPYSTALQEHTAHLKSIRVSTNLGRNELFELGKRGPYHRYVQFPVEVTTEIEVTDLQGDTISVDENSSSNVSNQTIVLYIREGSVINLGTRNKLSQVQWGGGNAGQQGGNATSTYSYTNYNSLNVVHPQDPSGLTS